MLHIRTIIFQDFSRFKSALQYACTYGTTEKKITNRNALKETNVHGILKSQNNRFTRK